MQSLHFLKKEMKRYKLWGPTGDQSVLLLILVYCVLKLLVYCVLKLLVYCVLKLLVYCVLKFKIITCEGLFILICIFRKAIIKQETRRSSQRSDQHSASHAGGTGFVYRDKIFGRFLPCLQPNARSAQNSVSQALPLTTLFFLNVTDCCCKPVPVFRPFKSGLSVYFYTFPRLCDLYEAANCQNLLSFSIYLLIFNWTVIPSLPLWPQFAEYLSFSVTTFISYALFPVHCSRNHPNPF